MFLTPSISFASKQKDVDLSVICEKEVSQYFSPVKMMVCRHANSWFFLVILSFIILRNSKNWVDGVYVRF